MSDWPDNDTWERWKNDPSKWFWGLFYFNREDTRLLVPKRIVWMGITVNFAHPLAIGFFILLVAIAGITTTFAK